MRVSLVSLLGCLAISHAWLPSDKDLFGKTKSATVSNLAAGKGRVVNKWPPASGKIRGVNLGSMFVVEPWMASNEWATMGCGLAQSEFDCVSALGQTAANAAFQAHWARWISESDIATMSSYGLNTIRIPVGYWIDEGIVYSDCEHFPQGGLAYLDQVCGWASDYGLYIIIDLHGAPGAQVAQQPFTGQVSSHRVAFPTHIDSKAKGCVVEQRLT
jgi:glucan endo-1,6-beta-glucosidase